MRPQTSFGLEWVAPWVNLFEVSFLLLIPVLPLKFYTAKSKENYTADI